MAAPTHRENKDRIEELISEMNYSDPEQIKRYISWTNRMSKYSTFNRALILQQMPNATLVGPKSFWRSLGRYQNTAHTIRVYQPKPQRYYLDDISEDEKRDIIDNHDGVKDGIRAFEKRNGELAAYREFMGFASSAVWDISQTAGDDLDLPFPESPEDDGQIADRAETVSAMIRDHMSSDDPEVEIMEMSPDVLSVLNGDHRVVVNSFPGNPRAHLLAMYSALSKVILRDMDALDGMDRDDGALISDLAGVMVAESEGVDLGDQIDGVLNPHRLSGIRGARAMDVLKSMEEVAHAVKAVLDGVPAEWARSLIDGQE